MYLSIVQNIEIKESRECGNFREVLEYTVSEREDDSMPLGIVQEYRMTFDKFDGESTPHLVFYARHQYVRVWIGEELVYSLMPSDENKIGKTVGLNWVKVHLQNSDLKKEILIEIVPVYESQADRLPTFLLGSELGIYSYQLREDMPQIVLSIFGMLMSVVFICFGFLRLFRKKSPQGLIALGLFAFLIGLWRIRSRGTQPSLVRVYYEAGYL